MTKSELLVEIQALRDAVAEGVSIIRLLDDENAALLKQMRGDNRRFAIELAYCKNLLEERVRQHPGPTLASSRGLTRQ